MAKDTSRPAFFVGYLPIPRPLIAFLAISTVIIVGLAIGAGLAIALTQPDPGSGRMAFGMGRQLLTGFIDLQPYPVLRVAPQKDGETARSIVLSGRGKRGILGRASRFIGQPVDIRGIFIIRDKTMMLQVGGGRSIRKATKPRMLDGFEPAMELSLGRQRLRGEIIDSKCYLGAMRPGQGKVHKACAGLCLMGGIPPMFAVYRDNAPADLLLLAGPDGGPIPETFLDQVSHYVSLEGEVRRRDNLLIFRVDPASLQEP